MGLLYSGKPKTSHKAARQKTLLHTVPVRKCFSHVPITNLLHLWHTEYKSDRVAHDLTPAVPLPENTHVYLTIT